MTSKSELRKQIRNAKRQFTRQQLGELSLSALSRLKADLEFQAASTVVLYYSLPDEVCTHRLIDEIKGKTILLPRVVGEHDMELRMYTGSGDLRMGSFSIMEPTGRLFTDYTAIDLVVVPGMAFDNHGHRLGRGKGYYDRFLAKVPRAHKIGICFGFQKLPTVPTEPTDISMDKVYC